MEYKHCPFELYSDHTERSEWLPLQCKVTTSTER